MCWRSRSSETATGDGYEWICSYLTSYDSDLLELELDVDGQYFFDNMDLQITSPPQPNEDNGAAFQLTPFVLSVISEFPSHPDIATPDPELVSKCSVLDEAQTITTRSRSRGQLGSHAVRHAVTTPRKRRTRDCSDKTKTTTLPSGTCIVSCMRPNTRSSSRKKFKRRLFY
ncbi:unnamed protein product [Peronospora belbahrii]|uniref:Uncharacterized protein n=1 Tax=Peronospora belbahrii TaxID=622444 RepID=A0AAU9KZV3_9STRA|nr:unnamed protein product [Peronospora belbahrii]CAH0517388.1 unnamed protein product [Peronospora belbahrii]